MFKRPVLVSVCLAALVGAASAACPTSVPGDTAEAIRANAERVQCLQEEVEQDSRRRQYELELRANRNALNTLQLQRRFDNLTLQPGTGLWAFALCAELSADWSLLLLCCS